MTLLFFLIVFFGIFLFALLIWRSAWIRSITRQHLWSYSIENTIPIFVSKTKRFGANGVWVAFLPGAFLFFVLQFYLSWQYSLAFSFLASMMLWQIVEILTARKINIIEEQLADMVDLMTSGLQAGSGPVAAMETATLEIGRPIGPVMKDVLGRLKLGDSPTKVFNQLAEQADMETFKIFGASMAVHWETGGRLVPLLNTVSKMIRDRIEVMRNGRLQSAQGKISAIVFVLATYLLAYAVWRYDPKVMASFLNSSIGSSLMAFLIVLQAIGMIWIHKMTTLRY